ncbi:MAG: heterodisulfide reductase-related iron-sulfur binding cluster [Candidatus Hermodarchaeota archaeon]
MTNSSISSTEFLKFKEYYIKECKECGVCFKNCFACKNTKYPIHKNLKSLFKNNLDEKNVKRIKKFLKSCLYCKSCQISCQFGLELSERLPAIKFELFKNDKNYTWLPHNIPSIFGKFIDGRRIACLLRNLNNYLIPLENRKKYDINRIQKPRDVLFFSGCGIQMLENQYYTLLEILNRLDINFGLIEGSFDKPVCCGVEFIEYGKFEHGIYLLNNLVNEIKKFNTKKVIVYCATCYYGLKKLAPQLIKDFDLEIIYAADYIAELLKKEKNRELFNTSSIKPNVITIHDSCHLAYSGDTSSIRNLLSVLPKLSISEMKHNKQNTICDLYCIIRELKNPLNLILRKNILPIINEAVESNADALCSLCPGCHAFLSIFGDGFSSSLGLTKKRILVKNWVSILGEYLGIRKRDMLNYRFSHFITIPFKDSGLWYLLQIFKAFVRGYIGLKEPWVCLR